MQFAAYFLDRLAAIEDPNDVILTLTARLREAGFHEDALREIGQGYHYPTVHGSIYGVLRHVRGDDPLSVMARLFSLSLLVERAQVEKTLTPALVERLRTWGLLAASDECLASTVDIFPVLGRHVVTDHEVLMGSGQAVEPVYPLGADSYALARLTPRRLFVWAVDMCTGSGVHAILAAGHCQRVDAVDLSPRALDFAIFNAGLNGAASRCRFWRGNLFEALPPGRFDLIVTNPPWVPAPDPTDLYRGGGVSGEDLTSRIVTAFQDRLQVGGVAAVYHEYPEYAGQTFLERVRGWLGPGPWGLALVNLKHQSAAQYALGHTSSHGPENVEADFERWISSYEEQGIVGMVSAVLYVLRLPAGAQDWDVVREARFPAEEQSWVTGWLDSLARLQLDGDSRLRPGPGELWVHGDEARVEWPGTCLAPLSLSPEEARLAALCDGQRSLAELGAELATARHLVEQGVLSQ